MRWAGITASLARSLSADDRPGRVNSLASVSSQLSWRCKAGLGSSGVVPESNDILRKPKRGMTQTKKDHSALAFTLPPPTPPPIHPPNTSEQKGPRKNSMKIQQISWQQRTNIPKLKVKAINLSNRSTNQHSPPQETKSTYHSLTSEEGWAFIITLCRKMKTVEMPFVFKKERKKELSKRLSNLKQ